MSPLHDRSHGRGEPQMAAPKIDDLRQEQQMLHLIRPGHEQTPKRLSFDAWMAGEALHSR